MRCSKPHCPWSTLTHRLVLPRRASVSLSLTHPIAHHRSSSQLGMTKRKLKGVNYPAKKIRGAGTSQTEPPTSSTTEPGGPSPVVPPGQGTSLQPAESAGGAVGTGIQRIFAAAKAVALPASISLAPNPSSAPIPPPAQNASSLSPRVIAGSTIKTILQVALPAVETVGPAKAVIGGILAIITTVEVCCRLLSLFLYMMHSLITSLQSFHTRPCETTRRSWVLPSRGYSVFKTSSALILNMYKAHSRLD